VYGEEIGAASASASVVVIVLSSRIAGSVVSNSTTSITCSFGTSFTKWPWLRVRVRRCLAGCRRVIRERDPERPTFAGVECMHVAAHSGRNLPRRDRARNKKRAIEHLAGCVYVASDAGRAHRQKLAGAAIANKNAVLALRFAGPAMPLAF
jgi:hypothetical protein